MCSLTTWLWSRRCRWSRWSLTRNVPLPPPCLASTAQQLAYKRYTGLQLVSDYNRYRYKYLLTLLRPKGRTTWKKTRKVLKHVNNTINLNEQHDLTWFQWFPQLYIVFCVLVLWVWRLFFLCFILFYVIFLGRLLGCTSTLSHLSYAVCSCTLCCMRSWQINDDDNDNERNKDQIQQIRTDSFFSAFVPNNFSYFVCLLSALSDVLSCYMLFFLSHLFVQFAIVFFVTYERWHHYLR